MLIIIDINCRRYGYFTYEFIINFMLTISAEDACASSPCLNMGQCLSTPNKDYTCDCPLPYTAKDCSQCKVLLLESNNT